MYQLYFRLYKRSIELYPDQSLILLKYAGFLRHARKDPVQAETYYERACSSNPKNSDALGNYASYLHGTSEKLDLCEQLCKLRYKFIFYILYFILYCPTLIDLKCVL